MKSTMHCTALNNELHCVGAKRKRTAYMAWRRIRIFSQVEMLLPTFNLRIATIYFTRKKHLFLKISGIPSGSKSMKTLSPSDDIIFIHTGDIIFDQSACSIFARCQALVVFQVLVNFILSNVYIN